MASGGTVCLLYHFFYPDDVVSARHFGDLAEGLRDRGWHVRVLTSNRLRRRPKESLPAGRVMHDGIEIHRVWRPRWSQDGMFARLFNNFWLLAGWLVAVTRAPKPDVLVIGSDPPFAQLLFPALKLISPASRVVFWCFDLYPDAIAADKPRGKRAIAARAFAKLMRSCYGALDLAVDLGPCMRERLRAYRPALRATTLVPWALVEPRKVAQADLHLRRRLFGDARLVLLYSGNLGHAHEFTPFLDLARRLRQRGIVFGFAVTGSRQSELEAAIRPTDTNVRLLPLVPENQLQAHLEVADIHLASLRAEWAGTVVPSKFFGSLAAGRPLLYAGPANSDIARWIDQFDVGLCLSAENTGAVATRLVELAAQQQQLRRWQDNAFAAYHRFFSKRLTIDGWDTVLRTEMAHRGATGGAREVSPEPEPAETIGLAKWAPLASLAEPAARCPSQRPGSGIAPAPAERDAARGLRVCG